MLLVIDIGNSNIVLSLWNDHEWSWQSRIDTKVAEPQIYYENGLINSLLEWGVLGSEVSECAISSVVPEINDKIITSVKNVFGINSFVITPEVIIHLDFKVPHPYVIGSDLVSNAFAASHLYGKNALIVDFGTALTFTLIHESDGLVGVTIMPGIKTALHSLFSNTAQLPEVALEVPESAIGHDTVSAIQAGVLWGYVGAVKELISKIKEERGEGLMVIATGGLSKILIPLENYFTFVDRNLTLKGIQLILEHSKMKNKG